MLLRESYLGSAKPLVVDQAAKVIKHVKVLGRTSPNTHGMRGAESTAYADSAMTQLAEHINSAGFKVNLNHLRPDGPTKGRPMQDRFGKLVPGTAILEDDGVYADLQYLSAHPMASMVVEAATEMPDAFGLSINTFGRGLVNNGVYTIREFIITRQSSVDVVADAGTVTSLSESDEEQNPMKTKTPAKGAKTRLREDDMPTGLPVPDMEDDTTGEMSPEDQLKAGFRAAIMSVVDDDSMDIKQKCDKISNYIKTHAKLASSDTEADEGDDGDDGEDETETEESLRERKPAKGLTKLQEELATLKRKTEVREQCDEAGFMPSKPLFEALCGMADAKARKTLIEEQKKLKPTAAPGTTRSSARPVQESISGNGAGNAPAVTDGKTFASALKMR